MDDLIPAQAMLDTYLAQVDAICVKAVNAFFATQSGAKA